MSDYSGGEVSLERKAGSVRKLNSGFGFIAGDDGLDYFFHWSGMDRHSLNFKQLELQMRVTFNWTMTDRGVRAIMIAVDDREMSALS